MKHAIIILLLLVAGVIGVYAQSTFALQYTINFPMGSTKDFVEKTSFRGGTLDYRYNYHPNIGVGISLGWYTFYEKKDFDTYQFNDDAAAISGTQYRYINSVPILAFVDYTLSPDDSMSPFFGLGIGTTYNRVDNEMGMYTTRLDPWQFTLAPQAGFRFQARPGSWAFLSVRYNYSFEADDLDAMSYLSLNVGWMFGN